MNFMNIKNCLISSNRYLLSGKKPKPDISTLSYMPEFKLGTPINSGLQSVVYNVQGYPDLVAKVNHDRHFCPMSIRKKEDNIRHIWGANADESIIIMNKVRGVSLYEPNWNICGTPNLREYLNTLDELLELPESAYLKYIDDIEKIRKNGCRIDTVNPNNILLDKKKKQFNIVDINKGRNIINEVNITDFYPFVDAQRLPSLLRKSSPDEQKIITDKVKKFFSKIENVGKQKNMDLTVEKIDYNKFQDFMTYFINGDESMVKHWLN